MREVFEAFGLALVLAGLTGLALVAGHLDPLLGWAVASVEALAVGSLLVVEANRPADAPGAAR